LKKIILFLFSMIGLFAMNEDVFMAKLANNMYQEKEQVVALYEKAGYKVQYQSIYAVPMMLLNKNKRTIIGLRGSYCARNWYTNLQIETIAFNHIKHSKVHKAYYDIAK